MKSFSQPSVSLAHYMALGAAVLSISSCSPVRRPAQVSGSETEVGYVPGGTPSLNTSSSVAGYTCPHTPNVLPYQDNFDLVDQFTVCVAVASSSDISVTGELSSQSVSELCAFPAQYVSSTEVVAELDPKSGLPAYNCQTVGSGGPTFFNFSGLTFNSVFIIESQYLSQMQQCLIQQNGTVCPNYSFGQLSSVL